MNKSNMSAEYEETDLERFTVESIAEILEDEIPSTWFGGVIKDQSTKRIGNNLFVEIFWVDADHPDKGKIFKISVEEVEK